MNDDLIAWYVYWVSVVINIPLLFVMKKEEFYEDGVTLFDIVMGLIIAFFPGVNFMIAILMLLVFFCGYAGKIIIFKPKKEIKCSDRSD